jgi:voltage-gated potassium channel
LPVEGRWQDCPPYFISVFVLLRRGIVKWWSKAPWLTLCMLLAALYVFGFAMMRWNEPVSNPIRSLSTYTYFFIVTVATAGYGDVVPLTTAGRLTAGAIAFGGVGAAAVALGQIFNSIGNYLRRREKGLLGFDMKGQFVIFGNRGAETAALIRCLIADRQSSGAKIVLCSHSTEQNPFPDSIDFVRGEPTNPDVLTRACVKDAGKIIIHAGTDYESISIALAVKEINQSPPIVVKANDPGKEVDIERVDRNRVVCIKAVHVPMIVREIHNPGSRFSKGIEVRLNKCAGAVADQSIAHFALYSINQFNIADGVRIFFDQPGHAFVAFATQSCRPTDGCTITHLALPSRVDLG